jgi:hypothetical protein
MARVPKEKLEEQIRRIGELISARPQGVSRQELAKAYLSQYGSALGTRTLQRRLEELVARERVAVVGEGPATVYTPAPGGPTEAPAEGQVPLTAKGVRLRDAVRRPIGQRRPVGYDREWLFAYRPGYTWYLNKAARTTLHKLGMTPDADRPAGTFARDILGRLLIDLSWASSQLEGNTYTRLDTQNLIEFGQRAEGKDLREAQMILNHKAAIELLVSGAHQVGLNRQTLLTVHAALAENLLGDSRDEGRLRERPVSITGTTYTPTAIPQLILEAFDHIITTALAIRDPFERSFFVMVHLPYLQPFSDVNKRTSRLAANIPLIEANLCPLSFVDVPEDAYVEGVLAVYEQRRVDLLRDIYLFAYRRSSGRYRVIRESLGEPDQVRVKYRNELATLVRDTVEAMEPPGAARLRQRASAMGVATGDLEAVVERALAQIVNLNQGSAGRHGIRPSRFQTWRQRFGTTKPPVGSSVLVE